MNFNNTYLDNPCGCRQNVYNKREERNCPCLNQTEKPSCATNWNDACNNTKEYTCECSCEEKKEKQGCGCEKNTHHRCESHKENCESHKCCNKCCLFRCYRF